MELVAALTGVVIGSVVVGSAIGGAILAAKTAVVVATAVFVVRALDR